MTEEEIHEIAAAIRQALIPPRCVSTEIPREVQDQIKADTYGRGGHYSFVVPMGGDAMLIILRIQNSGEIALELQTASSNTFWRAYLAAKDA